VESSEMDSARLGSNTAEEKYKIHMMQIDEKA
jgi:hypothetical protein